MDVPQKADVRLEFPYLLGDEHAVRTDNNVLFALQQGTGKLTYFLVKQWLTAADGDHGSAALFGRGQAFLHRHHFL